MSSFEERIDRVVRQVLDTRVDLIAVLMAESGTDAATTRQKLVTLVEALRSPRIEDTIFEGGRRLPMDVVSESPPLIRMNRELLSRVGDEEILTALARPVAQITELAGVSVSLVFQITDEQSLRDLAMRGARRSDLPIVRAAEIPAWVTFRIEMLVDRLRRMCSHLGRESTFDTAGSEALAEQVLGTRSWPEWTDVSDVPWARSIVDAVRDALEDTPQARHAESVTELLWDSLALSPQSFLRHAGRTLRGVGGELGDIGALLRALAAAVTAEEEEMSMDLRDWSAYADVFEAWENLNRHEKAMFGPVLLRDKTPRASVIEPARYAFGLDDPVELPWDAPLVCWTVREQNALRDLLVGFVKTLPGHTEDALEGHPDLYLSTEPPLSPTGEPRSIGVQVVALHSDAELAVAAPFQRAWSACLHRIFDQFDSLDEAARLTMNRSLRRAYDDIFPDSAPIWARRFYDLDREEPLEAFKRLVTAPNDLFRTPVLLDPFHDPQHGEPAPYPTLMFPVGIGTGGRIPFFVPVVALTSTLNGVPLRVRIVDVPASAGQSCAWVCDRGLNLTKLSKQAVELILRAVRGDALHMAVFES